MRFLGSVVVERVIHHCVWRECLPAGCRLFQLVRGQVSGEHGASLVVLLQLVRGPPATRPLYQRVGRAEQDCCAFGTPLAAVTVASPFSVHARNSSLVATMSVATA